MCISSFIIFSILIIPAFLIFFFYNDYIKFLIKSKNKHLEKTLEKFKDKNDTDFIEIPISYLPRKQKNLIFQIIFNYDFLYVENVYKNVKNKNIYLFLTTIEENISEQEITYFLRNIQAKQLDVKIALPDDFIEKNHLSANKDIYKKIIYKYSDVF